MATGKGKEASADLDLEKTEQSGEGDKSRPSSSSDSSIEVAVENPKNSSDGEAAAMEVEAAPGVVLGDVSGSRTESEVRFSSGSSEKAESEVGHGRCDEITSGSSASL